MDGTLTGFLNVDKPSGLTSHDVVNRVRRLAGTRRVGHAGTLDPLATGVLVIGVGRATRLLEYVAGQTKEYQAAVHFGVATTTYDAEGEIVAKRPITFTRAELESTLTQFRGEILQIPPMYSAIKKGGTSLYVLARQGKEVAREARPVTIHELELSHWESPVACLRVVCSTGTYIRSLAHDLGERLGCGAHLSALRRTSVGRFSMASAIPLETLTADNWGQFCQPPDAAVAHLARLELDPDAARRLAMGQPIPRQLGEPAIEIARVYAVHGEFIGVAVLEEGCWRPKKIWAR
jgi:tRNA pseudouridine55 synthase